MIYKILCYPLINNQVQVNNYFVITHSVVLWNRARNSVFFSWEPNCIFKSYPKVLCIGTSTSLGSLQKFEGAPGEFKGALGSWHTLIWSPVKQCSIIGWSNDYRNKQISIILSFILRNNVKTLHYYNNFIISFIVFWNNDPSSVDRILTETKHHL